MRERPSDSNESVRKQYEKLLAKSIRIGAKYDELDDDDQKQAAREVVHLLAERVVLLRKLENLPTIEDVYPRVKTGNDEDWEKVYAAAVIEQFLAGGSGKEVKAAAKKMGDPDRQSLSHKEMNEFHKACTELARQYGYDLAIDRKSGWIAVRKGNLGYSLKHLAFPSQFGILVPSRISIMGSWREDAADDRGLYFDGEWGTVCSDPEMQREGDRIIALLS